MQSKRLLHYKGFVHGSVPDSWSERRERVCSLFHSEIVAVKKKKKSHCEINELGCCLKIIDMFLENSDFICGLSVLNDCFTSKWKVDLRFPL